MNNTKVNDWKSADYMAGVDKWIDKGGVYLMNRKQGFIVTGAGQWGLGIRGAGPTFFKSSTPMRFADRTAAESYLRSHGGLTIGKPMEDTYIVLEGLPDLSQNELWNDPKSHWTTEELNNGDCGYGPLPGSFT